MGILNYILGFLKGTQHSSAPYEVLVCDDTIVGRFPDRLIRIDLHAIRRIEAVTIDEGPWSEDLYFFFFSDDEKFVIASEMKSIDEMLNKLQTLPGFDDEMLKLAASTTVKRTFPLWRFDASGKRRAL